MTVTLLQDLPIVITGPGLYRLRSGETARIYEVKGPGTFAAKGAKIVMFRGKIRPLRFNIWHVSGAFRAVGESQNDIVTRLGN